MRWKGLAATCAAIASIGLASPAPASANGLHRSPPPQGWAQERVVRHYAYYPRHTDYHHWHGTGDRYAYRPEHRGYYPHYNSSYWRPAHEMRQRPKPYNQLPRYYPAWGYPRPYESHGGHHHWHW